MTALLVALLLAQPAPPPPAPPVTRVIGFDGGFRVPVDATFSGSVNIGDAGIIAVTQSGTWNITNVSGTVSLPTGAATAARQDTGNASLSSIDGKTPALVGGRQPVDGSGVTQPVSGPLTDAQLRAAAVPVSGTVTATGPLTDVQLRATAVPVSGPLTDGQLRATPVPVSGTVAATQGGTWTVQPGNTPNTAPWLTTDTPRTVASANNSGTCVSVTASTTVLASNASRRAYGFKASEANTDRVHCKLGATATTSNMPFGAGSAWSQDTGAVYTGVIDCIAASGTQSVCPYEFN